jgi:uncharacterized protein (TIRG00374 family)
MTSDTSRGRVWTWLFAALFLAGLVFLVRNLAQLQHFVELAHKAEPGWLLAAIGLQAATYASVAAGWNAVLRRAGHPQPLPRLIPVAISKMFADQAIPSAGMGGNVLLIQRLTALGTPRAAAIAALLISMIGYYASYAALAIVMLLGLWVHRQATPLLAGVVTTFLLIAIAIPSLALWLRHRGSEPLPAAIEGIGPLRRLLQLVSEAPDALVKDRSLIGRVTALNCLVFVADAATLAACLCAVGQPFEPITAFIALMSGSIAMTLAPIPLGLGTFEASCIAMLTLLGVKIEPAITATLLLRGLTLWLPLLVGLVLIRQKRKVSS